MTTKEISNAVGKNPATVARWIERTSRKVQEVARKVQAAKATQEPADYDLEETCAILEQGMGKNAAGIFRANAQHPAGVLTMTVEEAGADRLNRLESMVEKLVGAVTVLATGSQGRQASPERVALSPPPELMPRDALKRIVEAWARAHGRDFHGAWAGLYREYLYRYHRDISRAAKAYGSSVLDYAENENIIGELLALAYFLYGQKETINA
jgi:hypothetical protein